MSKEYNIGIYIRLSMADEDTGYGSKTESDSIGNQRMLINRFLDNHPELSGCRRLFQFPREVLSLPRHQQAQGN